LGVRLLVAHLEIPETLETERLILRRPRIGDTRYVFERWASDFDVATYMSWPRHDSLETTEQVVESWIQQWQGANGGAFIITDRKSESILGSTGFEIVHPLVASTGYALAKSEWGKGYATEALTAIVTLAENCGVKRLFAYCHHEHRNSARVMEKCDFKFEGKLRNYMEFPNLSPGEVTDVLLYAWTPDAA
jgi:ribosomal-protein-alanine N-acetyltransferase